MPCGYLVQMRCVYPPFVFAKFLEGKNHKGGKINNVMRSRRGTRTVCPFFQLDKLIIVFFQSAEAGNEIVAVSYKPRNKAPLTWTNAEGVTFTIFGAFEKDVLLKMAESITPRAFLTEGDGT